MKINRLVVKVGTSTLTYDTGKLNLQRIDRLARVLTDLHNSGLEVVLVTSGSIAVGVEKLKLKERPSDIPMKQAAAAVGQCELMSIYSKSFSEYGQVVAQVLLTHDAVEDERLGHAVNTFSALISQGVIPIVNENDTVSVEELGFGDNDSLSAVVAKIVNADLLVLLTDIDGLYNGDPRVNPDATLIKRVERIDSSIISMAGGNGTKRGAGGMKTKISAAITATEAGIDMAIISGANPDGIQDLLDGAEIGTYFKA